MEWIKKYLRPFIVFLNLTAILVFIVQYVRYSSAKVVDLSWVEQRLDFIHFNSSLEAITENPVLNPLSLEEQANLKEELKININKADEASLIDLPGIGPVLARRILEYRASGHYFKDWDDLLPLNGMGRSKLEKLRDFIRFNDIESK